MNAIRITFLVSLLAPCLAFAEEGYTEHEAGGMKYRVFEPKKEQREYKLLVMLPGGDGGEGFTGWCRAIYRMAIPEEFIAVQLIAPDWKTSATVWPTEFFPTGEMKKPVEELFSEVVKDVRKSHAIAKGEVYTLSWSSGGPAAYVIAATQAGVKGHFVAMSVFRENWLPRNLRKVKGQRFFLYHSPEDGVCKMALAETAKEVLESEKAEVKLKTYPGGHGWAQGVNHFDAIKEAFGWLVN